MILCSLKSKTSVMNFSGELLFCGTLKLTILRGGLRPPQHVRWNIFKAIAIYLKLLTIVVNSSISRCSRSPRSTSDNSILFYDDYNKSISNVWILALSRSDYECLSKTLGRYMFSEWWLKRNISCKQVWILVFLYFVYVCNVNFKEKFLYSMLYPKLVTLVSTVKIT